MVTSHNSDSRAAKYHEPLNATKSVAPTVSVIIPAHNEEKYIRNCIESILNINWPQDRLEILVINHSSTDATERIACSAGAAVVQISEGKIGAVRNAGLTVAKGNFVAYVDGDCSVPSTWLRTAIELLESDATIGAVGGPCLSPADGTWVEKSLAPSKVRPGVVTRAQAIATSSFVARTSLLREIGGFDETLISGEDDDMSNRIRSRGLTVISASDCHIVHHGYAKTWWNVFKKEVWHGRHHWDVRTEFDLTLILTFIFLGASIALPFLLLGVLLAPGLTTFCAFSIGVIIQFTPPFLFAVKRIRQFSKDWRMSIASLAVGYAYFSGHGVGLVANLWQSVTH